MGLSSSLLQAMEMMYEMESLANFPMHEPVRSMAFPKGRGLQLQSL